MINLKIKVIRNQLIYVNLIGLRMNGLENLEIEGFPWTQHPEISELHPLIRFSPAPSLHGSLQSVYFSSYPFYNTLKKVFEKAQ